jgi:hypothetical protein
MNISKPVSFVAGERLLGGAAVVLATKGSYVLAIMPAHDCPFVVWWVSPRGEVLSGNYHDDLGDAIRTLTQRAAEGAK